MKDHRQTTAAPRKDLPQRVNQRVIVQGKMEREDPVKQSAKCPTTVYVKNLAFNVDEPQLTQHFESCGRVVQVLIVRAADGRSRGFGFVEFEDASTAQSALMLSDSVLGGRDIVVSKSSRAITQKKNKEDVEEAPKGSQKGKGKGKAKGKGKGKGEDKGDKGKGKEEKGKGKGAKGKEEAARRRLNLDEPKEGADEAKRPRLEEEPKEPTEPKEPKEEPKANLSNADFRKLLG
ncbi:unnamed protein product [Effrenium voratum]|uniref:RRM domain-containing protein n=1 Tax=Effrenium voratum TaxID=2562239 RepID=A0AA36NIH4_9DINO|nr:unnamed protein product [Effrenium voratum]